MLKFKYSIVKLLMFIPVLLFVSGASYGEDKEAFALVKQKKLVTAVCEKLENLYPFPDIGKKTSSFILQNFGNGKYSGFDSQDAFVQRINDDLEKISKDGHLGLMYDPEMAKQLKTENEDGEASSYAMVTLESERWNNFGFKELRILPGNIGYLDLRTFFALKYAGKTAVASMNYFANCNALIIDLRKNGGGWGDMVTFLASYFFDDEEEIILDITRSTLDNTYYPSMTTTFVPGEKLSAIPVYILISPSTASAAEAFANIMEHFNKNTVLVGESTAGAQNPVEFLVLEDEFILRIPCWQSIYSYDADGWEGTGVHPDIEVKSEAALKTAHIRLLDTLRKKAESEKIKSKYQWAIDGVKALQQPETVDEKILMSYAGQYGNRTISFTDGVLYYQYKKRSKRKMIAVSEKYFLVDGYDFFRVDFNKEKDEITGLNEIREDGTATNKKKE